MTLDVRDGLERARQAVTPPEDAFERLKRRREWRVRRRRAGSAVVALTVAGVVLGGALFALRTTASGRTGLTNPGQGPTARNGASLVAGTGQFYYDRVAQVYTSGKSDQGVLFTRTLTEQWWAPDGSGRIRTTSEPAFASEQDRQTWIDQTGPIQPQTDDTTYQAGAFPTDGDISGLSTDPVELAKQIEERTATGGASPEPDTTPSPGIPGSTGAEWKAVVENLLQRADAPPALRSALVQLVEGLPGVQRIDDVHDPVGRAAFELRLPSGDGDESVFVDPNTLQPLAWTIAAGGDPGVYGYVEVVDAGAVVDGTTQAPQDGAGYLPAPVKPLPSPQPIAS